MAVTQQLARVTEPYLAACRRSARESADANTCWDPPSRDCLDLDWAPALLERAAALAGLDPLHLDALRAATDGGGSIDVGFLAEHPHAIAPFGPAPSALSPQEVVGVAARLASIDMDAILAGLPDDDVVAAGLIGHGASGPAGGLRPYLLLHFEALSTFFGTAADRGLLVVAWWD